MRHFNLSPPLYLITLIYVIILDFLTQIGKIFIKMSEGFGDRLSDLEVGFRELDLEEVFKHPV